MRGNLVSNKDQSRYPKLKLDQVASSLALYMKLGMLTVQVAGGNTLRERTQELGAVGAIPGKSKMGKQDELE